MLHLVITMASLYCFYINEINLITYYETFFPHNNPHWIKIQHFVKSSKIGKVKKTWEEKLLIVKSWKLIVFYKIHLWNTYCLKCFITWMFNSNHESWLRKTKEKLCRLENNFDWHDLYLQFMRYRYEIQTLYEYILSFKYWFIYYSSVLSLNRFWW